MHGARRWNASGDISAIMMVLFSKLFDTQMTVTDIISDNNGMIGLRSILVKIAAVSSPRIDPDDFAAVLHFKTFIIKLHCN